jgi:FtsZ-binding cell division protein ZapB
MDLEQLDDLEQRINQAVKLIEKLKIETQELHKANSELSSESRSKDVLIQQLREENEHLKEMRNESSLGKDKEAKIRSKVQQMLARLDELQYNL